MLIITVDSHMSKVQGRGSGKYNSSQAGYIICYRVAVDENWFVYVVLVLTKLSFLKYFCTSIRRLIEGVHL